LGRNPLRIHGATLNEIGCRAGKGRETCEDRLLAGGEKKGKRLFCWCRLSKRGKDDVITRSNSRKRREGNYLVERYLVETGKEELGELKILLVWGPGERKGGITESAYLYVDTVKVEEKNERDNLSSLLKGKKKKKGRIELGAWSRSHCDSSPDGGGRERGRRGEAPAIHFVVRRKRRGVQGTSQGPCACGRGGKETIQKKNDAANERKGRN